MQASIKESHVVAKSGIEREKALAAAKIRAAQRDVEAAKLRVKAQIKGLDAGVMTEKARSAAAIALSRQLEAQAVRRQALAIDVEMKAKSRIDASQAAAISARLGAAAALASAKATRKAALKELADASNDADRKLKAVQVRQESLPLCSLALQYTFALLRPLSAGSRSCWRRCCAGQSAGESRYDQAAARSEARR